jgi:hypothetical protein
MGSIAIRKINHQQAAQHGLAIVLQKRPGKGNPVGYGGQVGFVCRPQALTQFSAVGFVHENE